MKGRLLLALLFALLLFLGMQALGEAQPPAVSPQLSLRVLQETGALPPPVRKAAPAALSKEKVLPQTNALPQPALVFTASGIPLLSLQYYRAAYQAFHFSDSAG